MIHADTPGARFDLIPVSVPIDGGVRRLSLSCYELESSGISVCSLDEHATLDTMLWRLEQAFRRTGGIPDRLQLRRVRPLAGKDGAWSEAFERFNRHFGFEPVPVLCVHLDRLLDARMWLKGSEHQSLDACQSGLEKLFAPNDSRPEMLRPLPAKPFVSGNESFRRVAADGFVRFAGDAYSVPATYAGRSVWVRRVDKQVTICSQEGAHLATHPAGDARGRVKLRIAHFERARLQRDHDAIQLERAFLSLFPNHKPFLSHLVAQRKQGAAATLRAILALTSRYSAYRMAAAFQHAVTYNNLSHRFIQGILEAGDPDINSAAKSIAVCAAMVQGTLF